jgi:hypothetical protein
MWLTSVLVDSTLATWDGHGHPACTKDSIRTKKHAHEGREHVLEVAYQLVCCEEGVEQMRRANRAARRSPERDGAEPSGCRA